MENSPPLLLSQDQHTQNCKCKIETRSHNQTSSFVHIYALFLIVLYHIFSFYNILMLHQLVFTSYLFYLYLMIIIFILQRVSSFLFWPYLTAANLSLFIMGQFEGFYLSFCLYVIIVSLGHLRCHF